MNTLYLILLVLGLAAFLAAAFSVTINRVNLVALGLAFWILVPLIQLIDSLG